MKKILALLIISNVTLSIKAQNFNVADSVMKKYAEMICTCSINEGFETQKPEVAITILGKCIKDVTALYSFSEESGALKKAFEEESTRDKFNEYTIEKLLEFCPSFKTFFEKNITQDKPKEPKIEPLKTVKEGYFLDKQKMIAKKMDFKINSPNMRTYTAKDFGKAKIQIVYDIRFAFKNEAEAIQYYKQELPYLSEKAPEVKNELAKLGVSQSNVYSDNSGAAFGLDMKMKNYIFRIKNIVAKVFVSATAKATDAEMLQFAKDAIARIKAVK